jgi:hypothetical protein
MFVRSIPVYELMLRRVIEAPPLEVATQFNHLVKVPSAIPRHYASLQRALGVGRQRGKLTIVRRCLEKAIKVSRLRYGVTESRHLLKFRDRSSSPSDMVG